MDRAIIYQRTLLKVDKAIARLKSIGLNVEPFNDVKNQIVKENSNLVKKSYNYTDPNLSLGQSAFLEQDYLASCKKLEKLYNDLLKYEIYVMASSLIDVVKNFINTENKTIEGFNECREQIFTIIKNLNNSNTLDYNVEGQIIENIYHVVYLFIKEEIKYFGISETLNNMDLVSNEFMDREILKDIENIDLRDPKNIAIKTTKDKIDSKGFNKSYVDQTLISAIVNSGANILEKAAILKNLDSKLINVQKFLDDLDKQIKEYNKRSKFDYSDLFKEIGMTLLNASLLVSIIWGSITLSKDIAKSKKYFNKTTIYNPIEDNPYTITEEYEYNSKSSLDLVEYSPWEENRYEVIRDVTTYDLSDLEKLSYDEYLNLDLDKLHIKGIRKTENKDSLTLSDLYINTIRLIKEIEVNKEDFIEENSLPVEIILSILLSLIGIVIIYSFYTPIARYNYGTEFFLIYDLEGVYREIKALLYEKSEKKNQQKEILKLEKKMLEIIKNNEGLFRTLESVIPVLESNPEFKEMAENTKKRLSLVRDYSKKISSNR